MTFGLFKKLVKKATISKKGLKVVYKDGTIQTINNKGNMVITKPIPLSKS